MKLTIDKAGRITITKRLREEMHLAAGATFEIEHDGEKITLLRAGPKARLAKEFGIWVYQGGQPEESIPELIDRVRDERLREFF